MRAHTHTSFPLQTLECTHTYISTQPHTYTHTHIVQGAGRYKVIPATSTPSTFPQEMNTCDRCWKETLQCIAQNVKWGEKAFPLSVVGEPCVLVSFAHACMLAMHQYLCLRYVFCCYLASNMHVCSPVRQCWSKAKYEEAEKWRREGVNWMQSAKLPLFTFFFMIRLKRRKFCQWWWSKMKSALLKYNRSVEASEHYGVPFSSINLPIFHGCEGLFIDQGMIKWWSTVPQREPSSFSFFSHPLSSLLMLYLLLFLSFFPSESLFSSSPFYHFLPSPRFPKYIL